MQLVRYRKEIKPGLTIWDSRRLKLKVIEIFNRFIVLRDQKICFTCGKLCHSAGESAFYQYPKNDVATCGHLITSGKDSLRFSELNCHCQCWSCNQVHEFHPQIYQQKFLDRYGKKEYDGMILAGNHTLHYTPQELFDLGELYEKKTKELKQ